MSNSVNLEPKDEYYDLINEVLQLYFNFVKAVKHDNTSTAKIYLDTLYVKIRQASIKIQKAQYLCNFYDEQNKNLEKQIQLKERIFNKLKEEKIDADTRLADTHLCAAEKLNETLKTLESLKAEKESNEKTLDDYKEKLQREDLRQKDSLLLLTILEQITKQT